MALSNYDLKSTDRIIPTHYVDRARTLPCGALQMLDGSLMTSITDIYTVKIPDVSTADTVYVPMVRPGNIIRISSAISGTIATANAVLTASIGAVAITGGTITITASGSAAGDVDTTQPTAANVVAIGDNVNVATNGASTNAVECVVVIEVQRSA